MNNKTASYRHYLSTLGVLVLFLFSTQGKTHCLFLVTGINGTIEVAWNAGNIDTAGKNVGDELADSGIRPINWANPFTCNQTWSRTWQTLIFTTQSSLPAAVNSVMMDTNISGIGIQVTSIREIPSQIVFPPSPRIINGLTPNQNITSGGNVSLRVKLYKTEDIVDSGILTPGIIYEEFIADPLNELRVTRFRLTGGTIINSGCSVATSSLSRQVSLGLTPQTDFTGVGTTSKSIPFNIDLIGCSANSNVKVTLSDTSGSPSPGILGVLALIPGGATGVGIQLLDDTNTPITLDAEWGVGQTAGTNFSFQLKARYYQTEATMTNGPANSTANFTMTYD